MYGVETHCNASLRVPNNPYPMNKTALVTGASRGIGLAIVQKLLSMGIEVYGVARTKPDLDHLNFHFVQLDLLEKSSIQRLDEMMEQLDILVNNAGIGFFKPLENIKESEIEDMLRLNLEMPILLTRKLLPKLKRSQGHIIHIGSESALEGRKMGTVYCATKFGLRGFSDALFDEVRKYNLKVTLVHPGMVKSSFFDDKDFAPGKQYDEHVLPEDLAQVVQHILEMREGSVVREITVFPQKKNIIHT